MCVTCAVLLINNYVCFHPPGCCVWQPRVSLAWRQCYSAVTTIQTCCHTAAPPPLVKAFAYSLCILAPARFGQGKPCTAYQSLRSQGTELPLVSLSSCLLICPCQSSPSDCQVNSLMDDVTLLLPQISPLQSPYNSNGPSLNGTPCNT